MIERNLESKLLEHAHYYPIVTVTGPRQSGKTTLCRHAFPEKKYVSLEAMDVRSYATQDPRGFLNEYREGAVIDEVQHAPDIMSYLQTEVDSNDASGRFILTGSQHFILSDVISQSLAGRTAVMTLMPTGLDELRRFESPPISMFETLWAGGYPRIFDRKIPPQVWLADYVNTYVQRDVRQILNVTDLTAFTSFLKLCAGRTGQILNISALGSDCGINHNTAKAWLSVLETSFLIFRLPAWHVNLRKQIVKAPKLHFLDSGLVCYLLGIRSPDELRHHPLRGAIFESWAVSEIYKRLVHQAVVPRLFHYRDSKRLEVDLICESGDKLIMTEFKSGETIARDYFSPLHKLSRQSSASANRTEIIERLIYGGDTSQQRSEVNVNPWSDIVKLPW
ncbi:MAG: ATP-binding protein [Acidobacteria bacterium]|nr:ATP-binding protein [Acidobacteriota bacterium]